MKFTKASHASLLAHIEKWKSCNLCPLHNVRHNVVYYEGILPADLLYIGKAPNGAADTYGSPYPQKKDVFYNLLPQSIPTGEMILGIPVHHSPVSWAVTYLVSCGPTEGLTKSDLAPCWPKVLELVAICKPKIIVCMGKDVFGFVINNLASLCKITSRPAMLSVPDPFWIATKCSDSTQHSNNARLTIEAAVEKYCA